MLMIAPLCVPLNGVVADDLGTLIEALNATDSVVGRREIKSSPPLFTAFLDLEEMPDALLSVFDQEKIHPGMAAWDEVSNWVEANPSMADVIIPCQSKTLFGLPYGEEDLDPAFIAADLVTQVAPGGDVHKLSFPYLDVLGTIAAYSTAEVYRRMEAGETDEGLDLAVATLHVLRQFCDREFVDEQFYAISLLNGALENLRDIFHAYMEKISPARFEQIAKYDLPYLRPDRGRLLMPEGDRQLAQMRLQVVFDGQGQPDRDQFAAVFARIQSADEPLTRFGASRRWRMIGDVHASKVTSLEKLTLVYDDWWRRWRIENYDPILEIPTEFSRLNPVRYAAVVFSMQDIEDLFVHRDALMTSVYGTSVVAGVCGYYREFEGRYPRTMRMVYNQFIRKRSDLDPFDLHFDHFKYRVLDRETTVETEIGRISIPRGTPLVYSRGMDHDDDRGLQHSDTGIKGDILLWPPVKALERMQGLRD